MYLRPEQRGRGLGRRLLETALEWARADGVSMIRLDTTRAHGGRSLALRGVRLPPRLGRCAAAGSEPAALRARALTQRDDALALGACSRRARSRRRVRARRTRRTRAPPPAARRSSGSCPPGQRLVHRPAVVEVALVGGELGRSRCRRASGRRRRPGSSGEVREHVELRQRERRDPVHPHRVAKRDEVEPAAAALASGHRSELAAELAHALLVGAFDLGRERSFADARHVRLRDADHPVDPVRADADAGRCVRRRPCSTT